MRPQHSTNVFSNSGSISPYGGSRGNFAPLLEYGGTSGGNCGSATPAPGISSTNCFPGVQYYFTGRDAQTLEMFSKLNAEREPHS